MLEDQRDQIIETIKTEITPIRQETAELKVTVTEINETLQSHTASLMRIEQTLGVIKDGYDLTKEKTEKLTTRVDRIENHLGLTA